MTNSTTSNEQQERSIERHDEAKAALTPFKNKILIICVHQRVRMQRRELNRQNIVVKMK